MSGHKTIKPNSNSLPIGYRFNEFEIKEVIGEGGFGIVYRAYDHQLERIVAIKEYIPSTLVTRNEDLTLSLRSERFSHTFQAGLNSFIQEARLLARFSHPALLHVLRFWEANGTAYIGTQFYTGTTLKKFKAQYPEKINETWIRNLLPSLLSAINAIHQEGYLHCDISLDNIQIQENQLPVLLDFGSARKEIGNLSDQTEIMLKPGFAPIEQYTENSDGEQGPWSDIYALGAVLHTLIVDAPPPVSVVRSIEDHYQPLTERRPKGYSLDLLDAIDRALLLKPEDRPQTIGEMAERLHLSIASENEIISTQAAAASPMPTAKVQTAVTDHPPRSSKRFRPMMVGAAVVVVLLAGLILWLRNEPSTAPITVATPTPATPVAELQPPAPTAPEPVAPVWVAVVYFKLQPDEQLSINGKQQKVTPNENGLVYLKLAAGQYQAEVRTAQYQYQKQFTIDQTGTWLINAKDGAAVH